MRRREWVSIGFGAAAGAFAVFAIGSAFRWTQAIVAFLVLGALVPQVVSRRKLGRISPLIGLLAVALALTALSLLPLPGAIIEMLDPTGAALRDDGAALMDLSPWSALTRDPAGSLRSLVYFTILLAFATVALRMSFFERGRYRLLAYIAIVCTAAAVVVGVHELVGATKLYGIYELDEAHPSVLGPLLNENHLGGLMAIGTCIAIGLAMHRQQATWTRTAWVAAVAVCGATTAASGSRGALVALIAGGAVAGGVLFAQRIKPRFGERASFATSTVPIGIVAICVVVVVVYSSAGKVTTELGKTTVQELDQPRSKFVAWHSAKELISESPWIGLGRGGFESSFTRVHPPSGSVIFSHVENEYIQVVLDWGIIGAIFIGAAVLWLGAVAIRRWRDGPLTAGALGALAAIAVQSTVDFGVELLGLAVPVVAIAATVAYVPLKQASGASVGAPLLRIAQMLALVAGGVLLLSAATTTLAEDHKAIARQDGRTLDDVRATLERHPLDYFGYAVAAELKAGNDPASIRLLNHSLRLHPTHPGLHRMAARTLYRSGHRDQAAVEYAMAIRATIDPRQLLTEIVSRYPAPNAAMAIPTDYADVGVVLGILRDLKRNDVAAHWLSRVVMTRPREFVLCNMLYEFSLATGDLQSAEVAGRQCVELLPDHGTRMSLAKLLASKGSNREVIGLLRDVSSWRGLIEEKVTGWFMLCDAYLTNNEHDEAKQCLRRLDAAGLVSPERRRDLTDRIEKVEQQIQTMPSGKL